MQVQKAYKSNSRPYIRMTSTIQDLIESYGFKFDTFRDLLITANGIIAGSSAVRVWYDPLIQSGEICDFIENDIDIFISKYDLDIKPRNKKNIKPLVKYLKSLGWTLNDSLSVPHGSGKFRYMPSEKIDEIYTFIRGEKKIQIVIVTIDIFEFIKTETDISITSTHWIPSTDLLVFGGAPFPYDKKYEACFYIDNFYIDILKEHDTEFRKRLDKRIKKYEKRGFTMIEKPTPDGTWHEMYSKSYID